MKLVALQAVARPEEFYEEARNLDRLEHRNVVRIYGAGQFDDDRLFLSMEYLEQGSASPKEEGHFIAARRACRLITDVSHGLAYIHREGFLHRDIKPANILIGDDGAGKLSDFGLAERMSSSGSAAGVGYLVHLAPEECNGGRATIASDIYALGMTLYRLLNGDDLLPPYTDYDELEELILAGRFPDLNRHQPFVTLRLRQVMKRAMAANPSERYSTVDEFRNALEQCPVRVDWDQPEKTASSVVWKGTDGSRHWEVTVTTSGRSAWTIESRTGTDTLRRRSSDGFSGKGKPACQTQLRKLLTRITETGR